jgi:hypothetical protein
VARQHSLDRRCLLGAAFVRSAFLRCLQIAQ